jgi:hypothetical protein
MLNGAEAWPDAVDDVLEGDQAIALAVVTPARGVVLTPVTNFAARDRAAGTVQSVNSSVGMWKKLERIQRDPKVALAFHTREHGSSDRPEFVLVQGTASLTSLADRGQYIQSIRDVWEQRGGQSVDVGAPWRRWLRVYHCRVALDIAVERVVAWPDLACRGEPAVYGAPLPGPPESQRPPKKGAAPRINHARAARRARKLPNVLLGWVGGDGFPVVVPVAVGQTGPAGIALDAPAGLVPDGSRRAGMLAHWFSRHVVGQRKHTHTGWLEVDNGATYAPHTHSGYDLPPWQFAYNLGAGFVTRRGFRAGRRAGFLPDAP